MTSELSAPDQNASSALHEIHRLIAAPPSACRPTPLFWWSGGDIDRDRLVVQLEELAAKGIGGTIVGYSHLPNGDLDHGSPTPLSPQWWDLFRWFADESARLGLTVGLQDYGINGPLLVAAGARTRDLQPGSLHHHIERHQGPGRFTVHLDTGTIIAAAARIASSDPTGRTPAVPLEVTIEGASATGVLPTGSWDVSLVIRRDGAIGPYASSFDPLHPDSGRLMIETFYQRFVDELGDRVGTTFTTVFQDELDFGVRMPLWNDLVADRLRVRHGFDPRSWLPALWWDLGEGTLRFRAAYRDVVVELLEQHYFEPIFRWHQANGTSMYVDQISRGDLRSGRRHYGDYLQTMRWYDGPGNDDPDLTTPRSVAAFKVSASLARLNDRPVVANEAFHSSGWGIEPEAILAGLNAGFAYGVNHVIMHGLNHTTAGGWWEWASPDFHFRQPWWNHSDTLWTYVTRVSALLRWGHGVAEVAVLDPTQDLDLTGDETPSPELATHVLAALAEAGHDADLLDRLHLTEANVTRTGGVTQLVLGPCAYRAVVVPGLRAIRTDARDALLAFADAGGLVIVLGEPPWTTEAGPCPPDTWAAVTVIPSRVASGVDLVTELVSVLSRHGEPDVDARGSGLVAAHRRDDALDVFFVANVTDHRVIAGVDLRSIGEVQLVDPWTGTSRAVRCTRAPGKISSTRVSLDLPAGLATVVVVDRTRPAATAEPDPPDLTGGTSPIVSTCLSGPWQVEIVPCLDNRFGDFEHGFAPMGVESWVVDQAASPDGPWAAAQARDGATFLVLGPVPPDRAAEVETTVWTTRPAVGGQVGAGPVWRTYAFSYATGITDDPLLLDRMTGPHGLKGVPEEFLDPTVLDRDAPPGSLYYFWSTVTGTGSPVTVSAGSRSAYRLWVDGHSLLEQPIEVPAARTPAWHLRDLSVASRTTQHPLDAGRHSVLLRVQTATDQPTRASLAFGSMLPGAAPRPRLRWWFGEHPCLRFDPFPDDPLPVVWIRVTSPPGTTAAELVVHGTVESAVLASTGRHLGIEVAMSDAVPTPGHETPTRVILRPPIPVPERDEILICVLATARGHQGAAVLAEPVRWRLTTGTAPTSSFLDHGLREYSGLVRYRTRIDWPMHVSGAPVLLSLPGLEASARVRVNGHTVGTLLTTSQELEIGEQLRNGPNDLEVEVANTMINRFSILPSPFVRMQRPGGGFTCVQLTTRRPA